MNKELLLFSLYRPKSKSQRQQITCSRLHNYVVKLESKPKWPRDQLTPTSPASPLGNSTQGPSLHQTSMISAPNGHTQLPLYINTSRLTSSTCSSSGDWSHQPEPQDVLLHFILQTSQELATTVSDCPTEQMRKLRHRQGKSLSPSTCSQEAAGPASISGPHAILPPPLKPCSLLAG